MVGDCLDDHSMRLCQEDMAQNSSGDEIFACKLGATQVKSVLAPWPISCQRAVKRQKQHCQNVT